MSLGTRKNNINQQAIAQMESVRLFNHNGFDNINSFEKRLKSYQFTAFLLFAVSCLLNFLCDMPASLSITALGAVLIILARYFLMAGKKITSYYLLLFVINISLMFLTYNEGLRSGVGLFFFTSTLSFIFLINGATKKLTAITIAVCLISYFITFLIASEGSKTNEVTADNYQLNFSINLFLSFASTIWMAYYLAKDNQDKQQFLKNQQVFLDTIFNTSVSAEIIVDLEAQMIISNNSTSENLFRYMPGTTMQGNPACNLFAETKGAGNNKLLSEICSQETVWEGELTCIRNDDTLFPASVSIVPFVYNNKKFKKLTITDISEKKRMMQELREAKQKAEESVKVKSRFLSQMSHELRTPLNGIIGTTNLLLQEDALPQQQEHLGILKFSSEHMLSLVNEVLDLSKLDAKKIQLEKISIDFRQFIASLMLTFKSQCAAKGLDFSVAIDPEIKNQVVTDSTRLNQVLTNLLSNAIKFTSQGGVSLSISAKTINSDSQQIEFSITDTGIGISPDKQQLIFDPFIQADIKTTRKYGGTGLGLNISKELVELMGGELKLESTTTKGSRFFFSIMLQIQHNYDHNTQYPAVASKKIFTNLNVLIAEDNIINMRVATRFLEKWGVRYEKAVTGKEAVELFTKNKFDIILMDLEMPEMDGYDALALIRAIDAEVPAIAFTAAVFQNMKQKLKASGFSDYMQKPFVPDDLYRKLEKYSGQYSANTH